MRIYPFTVAVSLGGSIFTSAAVLSSKDGPTYRWDRAQCGTEITDSASCENQGCLWEELDMSYYDGQRDPWCYHPFTSSCAVNGDARKPYHFDTPDPWTMEGAKAACEAAGGCWQPTNHDNNRPWCFTPKITTTSTAAPTTTTTAPTATPTAAPTATPTAAPTAAPTPAPTSAECVCAHGSAAIGASCPAHGAEKCTACNENYHLTDGNERCTKNVCVCPNGTPEPMCAAHGALYCNTCAGGYFLTSSFACQAHKMCRDDEYVLTAGTPTADTVCAPLRVCTADEYETDAPTTTTNRKCARKVCTCSFGIAASGAACATHQTANCVSCDANHYLSDGACHGHRVCSNAEYQTTAPSGTMDRGCSTKQCVCPHGIAATGVQCPAHGSPMCTSCVGAFHLANGNQQCDANICSCANGNVATGSLCTSHAAELCDGCSSGFHMENRQCVAHTVVQPGQFVVAAGTSNEDVKFAPCPPSSFSVGQNAAKCSLWQSCPMGYGLKTEGTASSDRVCQACTQATSFSDVNDGSACKAVLECNSDEYETFAPTAALDRKCKTHSAACPDGQYTSKAPHSHADRECSAITTCVAGKYQKVAFSASSDRECEICAPGTFKTTSGNAACATWRTCPPGSGLATAGSATADRVCEACVTGVNYSSSDGAEACKPVSSPCAAGFYRDTTPTVTSDRTCTPCPSGHFKGTAGNEACTQWATCPISEGESQAGSNIRDRVCAACTLGANFSPIDSGAACQAVSAPCVPGMYRNTMATLSSDRTCTACPPGHFKSTHSNEACVKWRTCPAGQGQSKAGTPTSDRECTACALGSTFSDTDDGAPCDSVSGPCSAGEYMNKAATQQSDRTCAPCAPGEFKEGVGMESCKPWRTCAAGQGQSKSGTPTSDRECMSCVLGTTFSPEDSGDVCRAVSPPCAAGMFRDVAPTLSSDRSCAACAAGYFKRTQGNEACTQWRTCGIGSGKSKEGTATANRECSPCSDSAMHPRASGGSFSDTDSGDECTPVLICGSDEYQTAAPTLSSDRECATHREKCPDGQYTFKGVTAHADRVCHAITTCVAGKYETAAFSASSNRYCADCPSGMYQNKENELQCIGCAAGKHRNSQLASSTEAVACTKCAAGRFSETSGTTSCTRCQAGTYQATEGQTSCQECESGTYQHQLGQDECNNCAAGKHRNSAAASSVEAIACSNCESGTYQDQEAKLECVACVAGKYRTTALASAPEFNACSPCGAGRFQDADGEMDCISCVAGKHRTAAAASSAEDEACISCKPGQYQNLVGKLNCIACVEGKHRNTADASAAESEACTECAQGKFQHEKAQLACIGCAAGKHRTAADASSDEGTACATCASGTYQHEPSQTSCIACDAGKYRNTAPASSSENVACTACLHGRFQELSAQLKCDACPVGRFPHSHKTRCDAHNTMEHICRARRTCEATDAWKGKPLPDTSIGTYYFQTINNINNIDEWCDFQCAAAPDRFKKQFCPDPHGLFRANQMCQCHEKRTPTVTDLSAADKECNDHEVCSHVTCKKEDHMCPSHTMFKAWAAAHQQTVQPNVCDDGLSHHSIRVFHHGRETTCKHGHYCFMKGNQCVCVQKTPSRPDEDRCWYDVKTPTSVKACYRRCKQYGDTKACAASVNYSDTEKPVLQLCHGTAERVSDAKWNLCPSHAMDEMDGDLSSSISYTLTRFTEGGVVKLCNKCKFGHAKARFHNLFGSLKNGQYILKLDVCDAAANCATAEKAIEVALSDQA